jgi:hypothetical protein
MSGHLPTESHKALITHYTLKLAFEMNSGILGAVGLESPSMGLVKMDEDRHNLDFDACTLLVGDVFRSRRERSAASDQNSSKNHRQHKQFQYSHSHLPPLVDRRCLSFLQS